MLGLWHLCFQHFSTWQSIQAPKQMRVEGSTAPGVGKFLVLVVALPPMAECPQACYFTSLGSVVSSREDGLERDLLHGLSVISGFVHPLPAFFFTCT